MSPPLLTRRRRSLMARISDSGCLGCCSVYSIFFGIFLLLPGIYLTLQAYNVIDVFPLPEVFQVIGPVILSTSVVFVLAGMTLCAHIGERIKRRDLITDQRQYCYASGQTTAHTGHGQGTQMTTFPSAPYEDTLPYNDWNHQYIHPQGPGCPPPPLPYPVMYGHTDQTVTAVAPLASTLPRGEVRPPSYDTVMREKH